jgi:hypothetical protein
MKITNAIKEARARVRLFRHGKKQWVAVGPFFFDKPDGPTTHSNPTDYWRARVKAREWRANVALHLMSAWSYDAEYAAINTMGNLRECIRAGLREFSR